MNWITIVTYFCALSFYAYGFSCIFSSRMVIEFNRYKLARFRTLTGALQVCGASGLLVGLTIPLLGSLAAAGISLQMACGLIVRIKIGDNWWQCIPATIFMLLCGWLATVIQ